ncbi:flavin-containing monooxygenase [Nibribacter koreensis]|uniref:NAD(P)/FAD-dependent oxidoreductase n=1 Tax=Nibribacter koreensis TaxID=1084519 RepID=A0ABP8FKP0_9BACT
MYDVLVIGAGQAGLATGYYLKEQGKQFLLVEAAATVGYSWRSRYDSLTLFTPAEYCQLPSFSLDLPKNHYPTKDQIADYLEQYARHFQLPISFNQTVTSVSKADGVFIIQTNIQTFQARQVVIATGPFQKPYIPQYSTSLNPQVLQVHSSQYQNPSQLPAGPVLVVGAGNSGAQIAVELSQTHAVHLSIRKKLAFSSLTKWGKSVFWWGTTTGVLFAGPSTFLGKKLYRQQDVIYGRELEKAIDSKQIQVRSEIADIDEQEVLFKDGSRSAFQTIIWATGFQPDYSWLQIEGAVNQRGAPLHHQGISPVPGLFYVGLSWQTSRSSALMLGAGRDAKFIAAQLASNVPNSEAAI